MMHKPFVITIVGPESSGKTALAQDWAAALGSPWVPEYAREYLQENGPAYREEDLTKIAEGQQERIQQQLGSGSIPMKGPDALSFNSLGSRSTLFFTRESFGPQARPVLIVDSGMISIRLWARIKYGITLPIVEKYMAADPTSVYVLCRPVLPWVPDPLREAPNLLDRAWIYNQYLKEIGSMLRS